MPVYVKCEKNHLVREFFFKIYGLMWVDLESRKCSLDSIRKVSGRHSYKEWLLWFDP